MSDGLISIIKWNYLGGHLQSSENLKLQIQLPMIETYYIFIWIVCKILKYQRARHFHVGGLFAVSHDCESICDFQNYGVSFVENFQNVLRGKNPWKIWRGRSCLIFLRHPFSFESSRNFCSIIDTPTPKLIFVLFFFLSFKSNINRKKLTNRLAC